MSTAIPFPDAPYIPGKSARPPEGMFDLLKEDAARLEHSTALRAALAYFDAGYFWECHEVMEAVWLAAPQPSGARDMAQSIIQLANARLKLAMDRPKAARRLCDIVDGLLDGLAEGARPLGQSPNVWRARVAQTRQALG